MPKFKYTKESGNDRLVSLGRTIRIIEAGATTNDNSTFTCLNCKYAWSTTFNSVSEGNGCFKCSGKMKLTTDDCRNRLKGRGITIIHYGGTAMSKDSIFKCNKCSYEWSNMFSQVQTGRGCPKCANRVPLTLADLSFRLRGKNLVMTNYGGATYKKSQFQCGECSHKWTTTFNKIDQGRGCPVCSKTGFNPSKPTWLYILLLDTLQGYCYGFGITNKLKDRLSRHKRTLKSVGYTIIEEYKPLLFDCGLDAQILEYKWKQSPYTVNIGVDGFQTECVLVNSETTKMIFG